MNAAERGTGAWGDRLRGGVAVAAGFVALRFLLTPVRMQVLTRALAPADYGTVTLVSMSAHALALLLSAGGFEVLLRRLPAADPSERLGASRSVLALSTLLAAGAAALLLLLPARGPWSPEGTGGVSRAAVAVLFLLFMHTLQRLYFLLGCRRHAEARATQLLWSDAWFLAILPWGLAGWTAERALWAWSGWMLAVVAATWRWVPLGRIARAPGGLAAGGVLAAGLPMVPAVLADWTFRLAGQYVLLARTDAETMALYALAFNIAGIGAVVGVPVLDTLSTEFNAFRGTVGAAGGGADTESQRRVLSRAIRLVLAIAAPAGLALVFLARPIVRFLAGPAFAGAADLLPWTALLPLLLLLNLLLARVLLAAGRSPAAGAGSLAGAAVALALSMLWVVPHGARGVLAAVTVGLAVAAGCLAWRAPLFREAFPGDAGWVRMLSGLAVLAVAFAVLGRPASLPLARLGGAFATTLAVAFGFGWLRRSDFRRGAP